MGFESTGDLGYTDYFERLGTVVGRSDELVVRRVMEVLCGDVSCKQEIVEEVIGKSLAREDFEEMVKLTERFLNRDTKKIDFEDVELFDVLFTLREKKRLLEIIRKSTDLEKDLLRALGGRKMYFMRYILDNKKMFEHFLGYQLFPDTRREIQKLMRSEGGPPAFIKYIDSDVLSLMKGSKVIDLEKTSDASGTHMIRGEYPTGSSVRYEDGAKIVFVPGQKVDVEFDGEPPENVKRLFGRNFVFNYVQSVVQSSVLKGDGNVLVCAPTGSGKTVIGMMCILKEIEARKKVRVGYIAPMKALAREICKTIGKVFSKHEVSVVEHTSDIYSGYRRLEQAGVIVSTPEKFDILTRNTDLRFDLVIIDEIHIIGDSRGATIEAIVARMAMQKKCRIVGLSATLPNYMDVGTFIGCRDSDIFHFGPEFRKNAIDYELINVGMKEREMGVVIEKTLENLELDKPVIVFVHFRSETLEVASEIRRYMEKTSDLEVDVSAGVRELLKYRVGIHHAGLDKKTRQTVENLYRDGKIDVMVCTATLAWGVNLPGKTVIVKGTEVYDTSCGWKAIKQIEMLQMFGRAGRFGDGRCKGILVSSKDNEFLIQRSIDSRLLPGLCDCLNAEIVRGMRRFEEMVDWFKHTFYYTRLVKMNREPGKMVKSLVYSALKLLEGAGLIVLEPDIHPTAVGEVASRYYIYYKDAKRLFDGLSQNMLESSLLQILEGTREFSDLNGNEKEMESLKDLVPIPTESIFGLQVQCYIANRMNSAPLSQNLCRVFRALFEIGMRKKLGIAKTILGWCKAAEHRIFPYQTPLRHFTDDVEVLRSLEMKEIPFKVLEVLGKDGLDEIGIGGSIIVEALKYVPKFNISPSIRVAAPGNYVISIGIEKTFCDSKIESNMYHLFITDSKESSLVVCDTVIFQKECEYVCQNYGVCTDSPFLNIYLLSSHYLCPIHPVTLDLRSSMESSPSVFSRVWRSFMEKKASGMNNCVKLDLFHNEISTEVVVVPSYAEKRRLMLLGYRAYTYEEFVSWRVISGPVTIVEVDGIISNHLIEACMAHCIIRNIRMVLVGLPFTTGGGIESIGKIEKNLKEIGVEVCESYSPTYHGQLFDFKIRIIENIRGVDVEESSCLIICSTMKMIGYFKKFFEDARIASEYTGIHKGVYFATKRVVDLWVDRRWSPEVSQVHIVGTDYYDHETSSYVDYSLADVKRYSLLGKKAVLYVRESKKALYFGNGTVPLHYCSSERKELYLYPYWLGCKPEKSQGSSLFVKDQELTRYGMILCKYCVGIDTVEMFIEKAKDKMGLKSIRALVCGAGELVLDVDPDELEALSKTGVDLSFGKAYGMTSYVLDMSEGDERILQQYAGSILPVVNRLYLCLVEVSLEKMYLKTAFNTMFGLQNIMSVFIEDKDKFYNAKLCGGAVLIEVLSVPRSPMGWVVFFLFDGSKESEIIYIECPGTYSTSWNHKICYVMSDSYPGFEKIEDKA
ncbi:U5 small nuclear ribonucleoprotein helicase [Encephalitozoon intestinalis]